VENYFNYFTEIEEQFLRRRGGGLLLTTLDWALIETWKDAGIPVEAALRGIDAAFDRYDQRPLKAKKINSLAYCSQEVLAAAADMKEAAVGATGEAASARSGATGGFEAETIAKFLLRNADLLEKANLPQDSGISLRAIAKQAATTLRRLAQEAASRNTGSRLDNLERHLTVLEEKLLAALLAATPDEEIVAVRAQADRDLAPYRRQMAAPQIEQLQKQYVHKRLLEQYNLPRLSLFYM
jgi:hypothetical protein